MKTTQSIRPFMSLLLAVLLSIGAVTNSYLQAYQWGQLGIEASTAEFQAKGSGSESTEDSQKQGDEAQFLQGHSFHAVITATAQLLSPNILSPSPTLSQPPVAQIDHYTPSLCTPALLEYYCNLRQYYIAPHAP